MSDADQKLEPLLVPLRTTDTILRCVAIGLLIVGIAGSFLYVGGWFTPHALSPAVMINTFEQADGTHPGFRRNHAKGVGVSGYFESNGAGAVLSKAIVFRSGRVPIIGRFVKGSVLKGVSS